MDVRKLEGYYDASVYAALAKRGHTDGLLEQVERDFFGVWTQQLKGELAFDDPTAYIVTVRRTGAKGVVLLPEMPLGDAYIVAGTLINLGFGTTIYRGRGARR